MTGLSCSLILKRELDLRLVYSFHPDVVVVATVVVVDVDAKLTTIQDARSEEELVSCYMFYLKNMKTW